jgi:hypothetical protein
MAIAAELLSAYAATDFFVFDEGEEWAINVGQDSPRVDRLLERFAVETATVVTAYNPRSRVLTPEENAARHRSLTAILKEQEWPFLLGEGRDPSGQWIPEIECIVFGTSLAEGLTLARQFDQNAIVFLERGRAPRLEFPEG